ncbi:hypothetical protein EI42_01876 [Thermosporothrix hazakensis]|uniref:Excisionase family DNA binding protein n=2 Tax=Thermosporothrix TaxID=768650 RepID=A0A326UDH3_THEHA|nr:hypothetical protein [Thermosporothrix hazakensis]PZW32784.1 hypothetical protein EI42_01876 [Thermosporothrix hazakensis]BBH87702.1 hypothetical protein KTC_24530 [Thermosporothrix sp. COM3]GCE50139.1 hypothetical protein KTH_50080 [Thermosporothrix hazakensis]
MDSLTQWCTIYEAAHKLQLAASSIRRMISERQLPARFATPDEIALLLHSGRIHGVPGTGIRLIHQDTLSQIQAKRLRLSNC